MPEVRIKVRDEALESLRRLAEKLGVSVEELIGAMADVASSYHGELASWGLELRVKKDKRVYSLFEEAFFYGVEAWRMIRSVLEGLGAKGRFELEGLVFDPQAPSIEIDLVALEGSDLAADRVVIYWTMKGVIMEVYYYLEEGAEPPMPRKSVGYEWSYLPDEHAVVVSFRADSIKGLPPIHVADRIASSLGVQ